MKIRNKTNWKKRYEILEKMLIMKMAWCFNEEWAKRIIRAEVRDALRDSQ